MGDVSATMAVAKRLVELCRQGQNRQAIEELYTDDHVAVEVMDGGPEMPRVTEGKAGCLKGSDWFFEHHEIHGGEVGDPMPNGDRFVVFMSIDLTADIGPMAGQRMQMKEACLYTVRDGKISRSEYFYDVEGF